MGWRGGLEMWTRELEVDWRCELARRMWAGEVDVDWRGGLDMWTGEVEVERWRDSFQLEPHSTLQQRFLAHLQTAALRGAARPVQALLFRTPEPAPACT